MVILFKPRGFIAPKHFKLCDFSIFRFWVCLMTVSR